MNKAEKKHAEEIRAKLSHLNDKNHIERLVQQSLGHRKEKLVREARMKELEQLPTWEDKDVPHDPWSNRCLGCGRWNIAEDVNGQYGPSWRCPSNCKGWDLWLHTKRFVEQED
jgi:hypothetical protein